MQKRRRSFSNVDCIMEFTIESALSWLPASMMTDCIQQRVNHLHADNGGNAFVFDQTTEKKKHTQTYDYEKVTKVSCVCDRTITTSKTPIRNVFFMFDFNTLTATISA